jgi:hypothetical protein
VVGWLGGLGRAERVLNLRLGLGLGAILREWGVGVCVKWVSGWVNG